MADSTDVTVKSLDESRVAIVGGTSGVGLATARQLAALDVAQAKRDGIRVNAITPSLIANTPTSERQLADGFSAKLFAKAREQASLGVAEPEDIAGLIVYLASPRRTPVDRSGHQPQRRNLERLNR